MISNKPGSAVLLLPFLLVPLFYGLLPNFTVPFTAFILAGSAFVFFRLESENGVSWPAALPLAALALFSGINSNSYHWEIGLGLAGTLALFSASWPHRGAMRPLLPAALISAAGLVCVVFISARLWSIGARNLGETADWALRNPNILAMHLGLTLPLAFDQWRRAASRTEKGFYGVCVTLIFLTLCWTRSYGALLALAGAGIFLALRKRKRALFASAFCFALMLAAAKVHFEPQAFASRLNWMRAAWNIFLDYPLLGSSFKGGFLTLFPYYRGTSAWENTFFAHNGFLEILCLWGLLGLASAAFFTLAIKKRLGAPPAWLVFALVFAALNSLWDSSLLVAPNILALLGLILAAAPAGEGAKTAWAKPAWIFLALFAAASSLRISISRVSLLAAAGQWQSRSAQSGRQTLSWVKNALRWDSRNPGAWSDWGRLEFMSSEPGSPRLAYAIRAERRARGLQPARKSHMHNLKVLYSNQ